MKHIYSISLFLLSLLFAVTTMAQQQSPPTEPALYFDIKKLPVCDSLRVFIKLRDQATPDITYDPKTGFKDKAAEELLKRIVKKSSITSIQPTFTRLKNKSLQNIYTVTFAESKDQSGLLMQLRSLAETEYAEPVPLYYMQLTPNDFAVQQQPYSSVISLNLAWDITTGNPNIKIAIVDDAVRTTHEDLSANCWTNPLEIASNGIDDDGNGYIDDIHGYDVSDQDNDANPPASATNLDFTHGTHVTGIAVAKGNNNIGMAGVAYDCSYIPVKTKGDADTGPGLPDAYLGLEYAIIIHPEIINMSWGGFMYSATYQLLCTAAYDAGIVLVASAGNTGTTDSIFPACYQHVIAVGSTNLNDMASSFSTYGPCLDVMAPGVNIYSTLAGSDQSYGLMSGTSMAAPLVSGICALMLSNNTATTPDEVEACLKSSCTNINPQNPGKVGLLGSGRVDAMGALSCTEGPPRPCTPNGSGCFSVCPGHSLTFYGNSTGLNATSWYWQFPGGTPSTSTAQNPTVTYNFMGTFDVVLIACNQFGCDTAVFLNKVCVEPPSAKLSSINTGQVCRGSATYLEIFFSGTPPFTVGITDGIQTDTLTGITSNSYYVLVYPNTNTNYMLTFMNDSVCTGTTTGSVTLIPVDCGACSNTDFEFGNFSTWIGHLGRCCGMGNFVPGISTERMAITSGSGSDPYSQGQIPVVSPFGGTFSLQLGNYYVGAEAERMEKTFLVTSENASLTYEFAVVLEDPIGHTHENKPKFEIRLIDAAGQLLPDTCAYFQVTAGPETDDWVHNGTVRFLNWKQVTVDLSGYIGQHITLQFSTEDCGMFGHFGYAYLDARCAPQEINIMNFCSSSDTVTLSAPAGYIDYQWTPYGDTTQTIVVIAPQDGDSVTVTMRNIAGCVSSITHVFQGYPAPVASVFSQNDSICLQDTTMIWALGAGPGGTYHWYSSPPGFSSTEDTIYVMPQATTTYFVEVTNSNGCPGTNDPGVTVFVDTTRAFDLGNAREICLLDSVLLISSAGNDSLLWTSWPPGFSSTEDSITVSPDHATTYILNSLGDICSFKDSIRVNIYNYLSDDPVAEIPVCEGETSVTLSAPPSATNPLWIETGDTTLTLTIDHPTIYAMYSVSFTSASGCEDTLRFIINPVPNPIANAGQDTTLCDGFSIMLHASGANTTNGTYSWTSIPAGFTANTQNIVVSPTTDTWYIVTVTNGPDCLSPPSSDTIFVEIIQTPVFDLGSDREICRGDSVFMSVVFPDGFDYWHSDPPGFQSNDNEVWLKPDSTTTYYLTVNTSSCTFSDQFTIQVFFSDGPNDTIELISCPGDTAISIAATPGYASYFWPHSGEITDTVVLHDIISDTTLLVLMRDSVHFCNDTCVVEITKFEPSWLPLIVASDSTICKGDTLSLSVDSIPGISYLWTSSPAGLTDSSGPMVHVIPTDTTTYYCTTTENSCKSSDTMNIPVHPKPDVPLPADTLLCLGDSLQIILTDSLYDHTWYSSPAGLTGNDPSVILRPTETATIYLQSSSEWCSNTDSMKITVMRGMFLPDTLKYYYCPGESNLVVDAPDNYSLYYWTEIPGMSHTINYPCALGDSLMMVILGISGSPCFDTCMISISKRDFSFAAEITVNDTALCEGETLNLSVSYDPALQYYWFSQPPVVADTGSSFLNLIPEVTAVYYCQAQQWSCVSIDSVRVEVYPGPVFSLPETTFLCPGDAVLIDPGITAPTFQWSDGDTTVPRWFNLSGEYELTATNGPCIYTNSTTVHVMNDSSLIVPNVFTPNGDLYNDRFKVIAINPEMFSIKIYNRWGKLLFESDDPEVQWDGKVGNLNADVGVYYYLCRYMSPCNNKVIELEGAFHLLR